MLPKDSFKKIELVALLILGTYHNSSWKIIAQVSVILNRTVVLRYVSRNCAEARAMALGGSHASYKLKRLLKLISNRSISCELIGPFSWQVIGYKESKRESRVLISLFMKWFQPAEAFFNKGTTSKTTTASHVFRDVYQLVYRKLCHVSRMTTLKSREDNSSYLWIYVIYR